MRQDPLHSALLHPPYSAPSQTAATARRYTVVGGVMPYLKTSRARLKDGVKKGIPAHHPRAHAASRKDSAQHPVPAQTLPSR